MPRAKSVVWCRLSSAGSLAQFIWCSLSGEGYLVQVIWCRRGIRSFVSHLMLALMLSFMRLQRLLHSPAHGLYQVLQFCG